jgi:K+-transporting ATPase KdpF subunit
LPSSPPRFFISAPANGSNSVVERKQTLESVTRMLENVTLIVITIALFGYLLVALLRAEDF